MEEFKNQTLNLEILAEEAAEIIQIKSKIIRFGLYDYHPKNEMPNNEKLENEIGHFLAMVDILVHHGVIHLDNITKGRAEKLIKLKDWYKNE